MRRIDFVYIISRFLRWNSIISFGIIHHSPSQITFFLLLTSSYSSTCFAHPCMLDFLFMFFFYLVLSSECVCVLFIILIRKIFFPFGISGNYSCLSKNKTCVVSLRKFYFLCELFWCIGIVKYPIWLPRNPSAKDIKNVQNKVNCWR